MSHDNYTRIYIVTLKCVEYFSCSRLRRARLRKSLNVLRRFFRTQHEMEFSPIFSLTHVSSHSEGKFVFLLIDERRNKFRLWWEILTFFAYPRDSLSLHSTCVVTVKEEVSLSGWRWWSYTRLHSESKYSQHFSHVFVSRAQQAKNKWRFFNVKNDEMNISK